MLEALQTSVNPKVIETPLFQGVAQNGIQLNVKARITVRSNLDRYVGGAGEPTIVARVGEGVVSAVGAAVDHKEVLEYPDRISKAVLAKGLDAGTAFEIVSIDIADVDVGKNIGADLQTSQAEADRRIAQAKAAERQYAAMAAEQEMKAETQRMRAKVVEAEAQIPEAIAEAFRAGHLGVMDYYKLNNVKADTEMRGAIGQTVGNDGHDAAARRGDAAAAVTLPQRSARGAQLGVEPLGRRVVDHRRDRGVASRGPASGCATGAAATRWPWVGQAGRRRGSGGPSTGRRGAARRSAGRLRHRAHTPPRRRTPRPAYAAQPAYAAPPPAVAAASVAAQAAPRRRARAARRSRRSRARSTFRGCDGDRQVDAGRRLRRPGARPHGDRRRGGPRPAAWAALTPLGLR